MSRDKNLESAPTGHFVATVQKGSQRSYLTFGERYKIKKQDIRLIILIASTN